MTREKYTQNQFSSMIYLKYAIGNKSEKKVICIESAKYTCLSLAKKDIKSETNKSSIIHSSGDSLIQNKQNVKHKTYVIRLNSVIVALLLNELRFSHVYRQSFINNLMVRVKNDSPILLKILIRGPERETIDYKWNEEMMQKVLERKELDYTMSWLSTLGGAFSALGDYYTNCAEIAGKISIHQFKLALRIGDPLTIARCKLYLSLSLIQRGDFKLAKRLVRDQYNLCQSLPVVDTRLVRMCQGIWTKLKYEMKSNHCNKKCTNTQIKLNSSC